MYFSIVMAQSHRICDIVSAALRQSTFNNSSYHNELQQMLTCLQFEVTLKSYHCLFVRCHFVWAMAFVRIHSKSIMSSKKIYSNYYSCCNAVAWSRRLNQMHNISTANTQWYDVMATITLWVIKTSCLAALNTITHCDRVMHICVSKLTIIGSDNGLSPDGRQAI